MNALIVGTRKEPVLGYLNRPYLFIDDGELIDAIEVHPDHAVFSFDYKKHSFDPLKDMSFIKAQEFITVLDAIFPEGENTLTKKNSNFALLLSLLKSPQKLEKLIRKKDNEDAY